VRWLGVSDEVRARLLSVTAGESGIFWLAWPDLVHYFNHVTIVMLHRPYGNSLQVSIAMNPAVTSVRLRGRLTHVRTTR